MLAQHDSLPVSLKRLFPESYCQVRIVKANYQALRHIYFGRRNHRLPEWKEFLDSLLTQIPFPELVTVEPRKE